MKEYTNGEVTVVWKPEICIHSRICFTGLPGVFDPRRRPWIDTSLAGTEQIIEQVKNCPSGALSYYMNDAPNEGETPIETVIEVLPQGPLLVYGTVRVRKANGEEVIKSRTTAFCRCGGSANKPFCDGTHTKIGFNGE